MAVQLVKTGTWAEVNPNGVLLAENVDGDFVTTLTGDGGTRGREWAVMVRTGQDENLTAIESALRRVLVLNQGSLEGVRVHFYRREESTLTQRILRMLSEASPVHRPCFYDDVLEKPTNIKLDHQQYFEATRARLQANIRQATFRCDNPRFGKKELGQE